MNARKKTEKYIIELTNRPDLDYSQNLFESGILSSLDVLALISFVEDSFNIVVSDDDIDAESFSSIENIVTLIETLKYEK